MRCYCYLTLVACLNVISSVRTIYNNLPANSVPDLSSHLKSANNKYMLKRWRRTMTSDVSCNQSPIKTNMTLKGGIAAGYFRKLAEHVAMQLCIELCCEEKGCDVAFMSGKNCYGVQCFSVEQCKALPAKKKVTEPVMISHVTIKGERAATHKKLSSDKLQCSATRMKTGVTLRGGLQAGNFTDVGEIDSMPMCVKLCCVSEKCDVALMINLNCFIVACHSMKQCEMVKSLTNDYHPSLAYVLRKRETLSKNATSLQLLDTSDNQLVCKNSQIFYNTTLKGGYQAGNYTNFGKISNMSECVRLCCGNKDCDVALMLENNCFAVACRDSNNCLPVHAKTSMSLTALNPRVSYITSRSEEVAVKDQWTSYGMCHAGIISYDVSLRGGAKSGNFTPHGRVGNMETCISKCCQIEGCGAAMMLKDVCFTVVCKNDILCEKKQTPTSSNFNPKIAYVFRDKSKNSTAPKEDYKGRVESTKSMKVKHKKTHQLLAERLIEISDGYIPTVSIASTYSALMMRSSKGYHRKHHSSKPSEAMKKILTTTFIRSNLNGTKHSSKEIFSNNKTMSSNNKNEDLLETFLEQGTFSPPREIENTTIVLRSFRNDANVNKTHKNKTCLTEDCKRLDNRANKKMMSSFSQTLKNETLKDGVPASSIDDPSVTASSIDDPSCITSDIIYNVTLKGGMKSGKFKDRGQMEDIKQCVRLCCLLSNCDLAFMLSNTCFSVECSSKTLCEEIPARSSIYSPTLCYVHSRIFG